MEEYCRKIASFISQKNLVDKENIEDLRFLLELYLTQIITILSIYLIGLLFMDVLSILIVCICFVLGRKYLDGYHAKSFKNCYLLTILNFIFSITMSTVIFYIEIFYILGIIISIYLLFRYYYKKIIIFNIVFILIIILFNIDIVYRINNVNYFVIVLMRINCKGGIVVILINVVDDEQIYLDKINNILMSTFDDIRVSIYNSVNKIDNGVDFLLLDIDMPDVDGIAFSKQNPDIKIIFVTNYDTRIKEAFGPNIYAYVSKGNLEIELVDAVNKMIKEIKNNRFLLFRVKGKNFSVRIDDIIYCQFIGNHIVSIVCKNKQININNTSLKKVIERLDERFIKINGDTIINKNKIVNFKDKYVYLRGVNSKFEVSLRRKSLVDKAFFEVFKC